MRVVDLTETFGRFADAWSPKIVGDVNDMHVKVVKLRGEGVRILAEPYELGDTRAVMIEGPSREALELVEVE